MTYRPLAQKVNFIVSQRYIGRRYGVNVFVAAGQAEQRPI
jgi:hypothetical protein